ncbi:unnamed protein product [Schistosoma margrebowiei]|uniref:Uncharacterized protein n=1 Tax=Schistosoma margrebowiei TaxID=48269 RepID=A0A183LIL7_9TREM|nr:unnamed protein product [Schistosoma margrebowiei]
MVVGGSRQECQVARNSGPGSSSSSSSSCCCCNNNNSSISISISISSSSNSSISISSSSSSSIVIGDLFQIRYCLLTNIKIHLSSVLFYKCFK